MKDRVAVAAIARAKADGRLKPGAGANVCAAIQIARELGPGSTVLTCTTARETLI